MTIERIASPVVAEEELALESTVRPRRLDEFAGLDLGCWTGRRSSPSWALLGHRGRGAQQRRRGNPVTSHELAFRAVDASFVPDSRLGEKRCSAERPAGSINSPPPPRPGSGLAFARFFR